MPESSPQGSLSPDGDNKPTAKDMIDAYQHLTDEQKEMSAVREAHLKARPDIANLPNDFSSDDRESVVPATGQLIGGSRTIGRDASKVEVRKSRWHRSQPWKYSGTRGGKFDGEELSGEEAERIYKEELDPSSVEAFLAMQKDEADAVSQVREREKSEVLARQQEVEEAYAAGLAKGEKLGEVRYVLQTRLESLDAELSEDDKIFLAEVIDIVARLKADERLDNPSRQRRFQFGLHDTEDILYRRESEDEHGFIRRRDLMFQLLGARTEEGVKWVDGWIGHEKVVAVIYKTILPDMVISKDPEKDFYKIERNTVYVVTP